jgi:hypothetical protein
MAYSEAHSPWQPASFAEMGAAVPFTSPELAGARARGCLSAAVLTVPNPAGTRGVYILDLREVGRYCAATLHDRQLCAVMRALPEITPATLRLAAREVAASGLAGRDAAAAARRATEATTRAELGMQLELLRMLVAQNGCTAGAEPGAERAAKFALEALAARTGRSAAALEGGVEILARLVAPFGTRGNILARHPALLSRLVALRDALQPEVARYYPGHSTGDNPRGAKAQMLIAAVADDSATLGLKALTATWRLLDNVPALVSACAHDPSNVAAVMGRLDWLLDGWAGVLDVWRIARPGRSSAALIEMGQALPFIPLEAGKWFGATTQESSRQSLRAEVLGSQEWRGAALAHELVTRNEALRAMAA